MIPDEDATPIACRACGGDFRRYPVPCGWCTLGCQSPSQLRAWDRFRARCKVDAAAGRILRGET